MIEKLIGYLIDGLVNLIKSLLFNEKKSKSKYGVSQATLSLIENEWRSIDVDLKSKSPAVLKHALIKADKSLDNLLKDFATGNTMGERMISSKNKFSQDVYQSIWSAHKVRNSMVHDSGFEPTYVVLNSAIEDLRKGVRQLGARV